MAKKNLLIKTTKNIAKKRFDGTTYKSSLEKTMAMYLKSNGLPINYETKTFILTPEQEATIESWKRPANNNKSKFKNRIGKKIKRITYTPDFVDDEKHFNKTGSFVIEVKGYPTPYFNLKYKMFEHYCQERYKNITLYMPRTVADCQEVADLIAERYV